MRSFWIRSFAVLGLLLPMLLIGCGTTDTVVDPGGDGPGDTPDPNPYEAGLIGTDTTLEVMTWNVENFAKQGTATAEHVINAVEGLQVDIVALQEIENLTYFQQVREGLTDWTGDRATSASYSMNLAFLYPVDGPVQVSAVYEILTEYRRELPRSPFVLEGTMNGTDFVVINNHYKCCGDGTILTGSEWDEETRRRDASILIDDFIRTNFPDRAVIVVGDLNDELTDAADRNVFQTFFDDPDKYRFVDLGIAEAGDDFSYPSWPSHIDHILITNQLFGAIQGADVVVKVAPLYQYLEGGWSTYDRMVSDHLPVVMRIKL